MSVITKRIVPYIVHEGKEWFPSWVVRARIWRGFMSGCFLFAALADIFFRRYVDGGVFGLLGAGWLFMAYRFIPLWEYEDEE